MTLAEQMRVLRGRVDRDVLSELARPCWPTIKIALARDWACILVAIGAVSVVAHPLMWCAAFVVIGLCQYRLFVLGHDGLHRCLHPNPTTNDRIARWLIYAPLLTGFDDSRRHHAVHHEALGTRGDPERYLYGLDGKNARWRIALLCCGLLTFVSTVERVFPYRALVRRACGGADAARHQRLGAVVGQRIPVLLAQAMLWAAMLAVGLPWWAYLTLWLAPIYVLVFVPDEVRSFCDHAVLVVPDEAGDPDRLISYSPSWWERLLFAPYHLNLQAEHHVFPELPFGSLPAMRQLMGEAPGIHRRGSYARFLLWALRAVPLRKSG